MHIFFDWEVDVKAEKPQDTNRLWVYEEIRQFLSTRYRPLEEMIDAATTPEHPAIVVFVWHESGDIELKQINIAPHLIDKWESCITTEDMDYIMEVVGRKIDNAESGESN